MLTKTLPSYPYTIEQATALAGLLLDDCDNVDAATKPVLASALVSIVNARPDDPSWSWDELDDAIRDYIDCGESTGRPSDVYLDLWHQRLRAARAMGAPGLERVAAALDASGFPYDAAAAARSDIRVKALGSIRRIIAQMNESD